MISRFDKLTPRQREVLRLLTQGMSNKEIARALKIAEATTKIHMAALLRTLGARDRTEAAYKAGTADLPEPESQFLHLIHGSLKELVR